MFTVTDCPFTSTTVLEAPNSSFTFALVTTFTSTGIVTSVVLKLGASTRTV